MRHYEIYLIVEEVARHYFGQEAKLFQLFLEHEQAKWSQRDLLNRQIAYISEPIPTLQVQQKLQAAFKQRLGYVTNEQTHYLEMKQEESKAELVIHSHRILLTGAGTTVCETMFFEVLRRLHACFFAVDFEHANYGWLNPIKQVRLI
ncbi:sporulation inhibitor of replication protein SirA [Halalkalibacterium ligniniphilum]|uniref:sporulation inhibitor of replication protein SirA n=1 Tax=Halalkalibacterium ligniniphilum TaxID=1134413 RepID=UPI000347A546|nr:sporulation inhibitor of replication protein SirA [Halalkalibacterium ligniniphilum]